MSNRQALRLARKIFKFHPDEWAMSRGLPPFTRVDDVSLDGNLPFDMDCRVIKSKNKGKQYILISNKGFEARLTLA